MIVGYINHEEQIFCTNCWPSQVEAGAHPRQLLDSEDPDDPGANFWVVDPCTASGHEVKYQALTALN